MFCLVIRLIVLTVCGAYVALMWRLCGAYVALMWRLCGAYVALMWRLCGAYVALMWRLFVVAIPLWRSKFKLETGLKRPVVDMWRLTWRLCGAYVALMWHLMWRLCGAYVALMWRLCGACEFAKIVYVLSRWVSWCGLGRETNLHSLKLNQKSVYFQSSPLQSLHCSLSNMQSLH
jgi:hypothetical protein